jgi:hypothetical protein
VSAVISADGHVVAFASGASDLVAGMWPGVSPYIYVSDDQAPGIVLVSHVPSYPWIAPSGASESPILSHDGRFVVYSSVADELIAGYLPGITGVINYNVYEYDRVTDTTVLVSHASNSATTGGNGNTNYESVSDDGRFVAYTNSSTNLVTGFVDGNGSSYSDVYLFDRSTGTNTLVSHIPGLPTTSGEYESDFASVSGNGRYVVFNSGAPNLVAGTIVVGSVFLYDRVTGLISQVDRPAGLPDRMNESGSGQSTISADGKVIYFASDNTDMVPGDFDHNTDIFSALNQPPRVSSTIVADGSAQRSVVRSLTVTIDQPVLFAGSPAAAFTLTRTGPGGASGPVPLTASVVTGNSTVVTLTFSGPLTEFGSLVDGRYELKLSASQVMGTDALDGNGDGVAGDDYTFDFHRLFGDADGDGSVSASDFAVFRVSFASSLPVFDFYGDGFISANDFIQFRLRFGGSI